jgi:DNA topoisomerase-6 subunit B
MCDAIGVSSRAKAGDIEPPQAEKLYKVFQESKLAPPPTDCLAPIGVRQLLAGMLKGVRAEFYSASSRPAEVYRGRPFQIEAAIAFGGELAADEAARVIRFANRVPLLFQQSACSSFKAVTETAWKNYSLQQPRGGLPVGPLVIMIHMASVWVPFTSESKEAIADYDEIRKEMKLALMECGRKLGTYLRKRQKMRREGERRDVFERYIGEIAKAINSITGEDPKRIYDALLRQAQERTAVADQVLDEDGKVVKDEPMDIEGVIVVPGAIAPAGGAAPAPAAPEVADAPARRRRSPKAEPAAGGKPAAGAKPAAKQSSKAGAARAELRARAAKAAGRGGKQDGPRLF